MKKLWITLIIMAVGATTALFAQEKSSFNIMQERFAYMREHLTLGEKEGDAFWKTYSQYLKEESAIMDALGFGNRLLQKIQNHSYTASDPKTVRFGV